MNILADASLPFLNAWFPEPFKLTTYSSLEQLKALISSQQILLCRSTLSVSKELLAASDIQYVATASSGIDHIDSEFLQQQGIKLFDAKGCNARSVGDYIVTVLAWLEQQKFIKGGCAGIIGAGKVGSHVLPRLQAAGYSTKCYDPMLPQSTPGIPFCSFLEDLLSCKILLVHANLHSNPPFASENLLDEKFLSKLSPGTVLINAARGGIVNESALLKQPHLIYCTDVYQHEPAINARIIEFATLCTPHIAGHSIDAKIEAVRRVSEKIHHDLNLTMPSPQLNDLKSQIKSRNQSWQEYVLEFYNPYVETTALKSADNKEQAFLSLRKAHQKRRDFNQFCFENSSPLLNGILGIN
jgi:erythronate-4-phosphate dehydrogenase